MKPVLMNRRMYNYVHLRNAHGDVQAYCKTTPFTNRDASQGTGPNIKVTYIIRSIRSMLSATAASQWMEGLIPASATRLLVGRQTSNASDVMSEISLYSVPKIVAI